MDGSSWNSNCSIILLTCASILSNGIFPKCDGFMNPSHFGNIPFDNMLAQVSSMIEQFEFQLDPSIKVII